MCTSLPALAQNSSQFPPNQRHIHFLEVKYWLSTAKMPGLGASSKPLTISTARSINTFAKLRPMSASKLPFWEWGPPSAALIVGASVYIVQIGPQKGTKLSVKFHAHLVQCAHNLVSTRRALENFCNKSSSRPGVGTASHPPDPTDFFCFSLLADGA